MRILLLLCLAVPALCARVSERIINGFDAAIVDYPYTLSLRASGAIVCGAVLIANDRALTAAQCAGQATFVYSIAAGSNDHTVTSCSTCITRNVDAITIHPEYDASGAGAPNDIAIVFFTALVPNANVAPIAMATLLDGAFIGQRCTFTGWGATTNGGGFQQLLQFSTGLILSNNECGNYWGANPIDAGHICVQDADSAICQGDYGGPLECPGGAGGAALLAGIASWGHATCDPTYPSVFTRIGNYYNWINDQPPPAQN